MDQKFITGGTILSGVIITGCGLMVAPLAVGMLLSYPHQIWLLGVVLAFSSIAMIIGGIKQLISARKKQQQVDQTQTAIQEEILSAKVQHIGESINNDAIEAAIIQNQEAAQSAPIDQVILAKWHFTAAEWNRFLQYEKRERKMSSTIESVIIILLGGALLMFAKNANAWLAFGISGVIASIYWLGKYYLSMGSLGASRAVNEVIITPVAIIINGKYNVLRNDRIWLSKVVVKNETAMQVLEFTFNWSTRKGDTFEEIRIPIPENKLAEAEALAKIIIDGPPS
jgi:hypothetical protein